MMVLGGLWAAWWHRYSRPFESTDDSYAAGNQIRVTARTSGRVAEIFVESMEEVAAGQLLIRLDPTDASLALERASSELAQAARQISSLKAQRGRLIAVIEARERELALSQAELKRRQGLKAGQSVTAEELERYLNQAAVAKANLEAAKKDLEVTERLLGPSGVYDHPQVALAKANLKAAWLSLKRCEVRSPAAGTVAKRAAQVGLQVDPSTPLIALVAKGQVWVEANFKESQLGRVKPGQRATVKSDMYGGARTYRGVVAGLSPGTGSVFSLLPPENATGNWIKVVQRVPTKIIIDPADLAAAPLILGLSMRTKIHVLGEAAEVPPFPEGPDYSAFAEDYDEAAFAALAASIIKEAMAPAAAEPSASETSAYLSEEESS
ncbi:MAG: efflux RND transporter periplasmic adaptor subunit [Deltaproteobacteria bacterium]|jgi:membrane fusion protein (multidrug efflux system)|nr:efflux RND transporter periplasmic adaptor subunit [Deltaproteobacteria bacterium]